MTAALTYNTSQADETVPDAPRRPDGSTYRYEMIHAGGTRRAYADTATALTAALIEGYLDLDAAGQWHARLALAARAQVAVQAHLNTADSFHRATSQQQEILNGPRHEPPVVAAWDCPIPLVLVATHYEPAGLCPRPRALDGMPPNVIWIDPSDDLSLLGSLHDVSVIALHEANKE